MAVSQGGIFGMEQPRTTLSCLASTMISAPAFEINSLDRGGITASQPVVYHFRRAEVCAAAAGNFTTILESQRRAG
jgi:hypothetical protein